MMRRSFRSADDRGLTLIELLITIVLLGVIVAPITAAFVVSFRNIGGTVEGFTDGHELLSASSFFMSDVQDADAVDTSRLAQLQVDLKAVRFANSVTGWVAGSRGVVLRTDDQGVSYSQMATGTTADLFGLAVVSGNDTHAWAFGADATIIRTTDAGSTWTAQSAPAGVTQALRRGVFKDVNNGLIVGDGGTVLRTINGGATWTKQSSGTLFNLRAIAFRNGTEGLAVGDNGTVIRTSNFGSSWSFLTKQPPMTTSIRGIYFRDDKRAWIVGDRDPTTGFALVVCTDKCNQHDPRWIGMVSAGTTQNLVAISGVSRDNVWAAGEGGAIVRCSSSCDEAGVWVAQDSSISETVNAIHAIDTTHIWAVADAGTLLRSIYNRWAVQPVPAGFTHRLNSVSCVNADKCLTVGHSGSALVTNNGGATWATQSTGTSQNLRSVVFVSDNKAIAVGDQGTIRICTNNCRFPTATWFPQVSATVANLNSVFWAGNDEAYAVGSGGTMRVCTNDCDKITAVWVTQTQVLPVLSSINAVFRRSDKEAWAVGDSGRIFVCSTDCRKATAIWLQATSPTTENLQSISCESGSNCIAVGDGGVIVKCSASCKESSSTWTLQDSVTSANLNRVRNLSSTVAYVAGAGGTILSTDDGGTTWFIEGTPISTNLWGVAAVDAAKQWAVGGNGTIITTVTGGSSFWQYASDEALEEIPANVCPGSEAVLISFWTMGSDGSEKSITYLVRTVGGDRVLLRQFCTRPRGASLSEPFTLVNEVSVVRGLAASNDPVLTCTLANGTPEPCSSAVRISLTFTNPGGAAFTIQGTRR